MRFTIELGAEGNARLVSILSDHLKTICAIRREYGAIHANHNPDGVKAGLVHREADVALICLETALPAKIEATVQEALGHSPKRAGSATRTSKRSRSGVRW